MSGKFLSSSFVANTLRRSVAAIAHSYERSLLYSTSPAALKASAEQCSVSGESNSSPSPRYALLAEGGSDHMRTILASVLANGAFKVNSRREERLLRLNPVRKQQIFLFLVEMFEVEGALKIVRRHPVMLGCQLETIQETCQKLFALFGEERGKNILLRHPPILSLSWENLEPKFDYIQSQMGRNLDDIALNPGVLCRSLHKCIIPRNEAHKLVGERRLSLSHVCSGADFSRAEKEKRRKEKERAEIEAIFGKELTESIFQNLLGGKGLHPDLVREKVQYLTKEMGRSLEEIAGSPWVLRRSLQNCIIPRHKALGERQREFSLNYLFKSSRWVFEAEMKCKL